MDRSSVLMFFLVFSASAKTYATLFSSSECGDENKFHTALCDPPTCFAAEVSAYRPDQGWVNGSSARIYCNAEIGDDRVDWRFFSDTACDQMMLALGTEDRGKPGICVGAYQSGAKTINGIPWMGFALS
jgi:hypothetical protein